MIALVALLMTGTPFLAQMGIAAAGAIAIAVLASLTLVPALLAFGGTRLVRGKTFSAKLAPGRQADARRPLGGPRHAPSRGRLRPGDRRARRARDPRARRAPRAPQRRHRQPGHHLAPGLRPRLRGLRRGRQRPADDRRRGRRSRRPATERLSDAARRRRRLARPGHRRQGPGADLASPRPAARPRRPPRTSSTPSATRASRARCSSPARRRPTSTSPRRWPTR